MGPKKNVYLRTFRDLDPPQRYIIRECTVMYPNGNYEHFRFAPPSDFKPSDSDLQSIDYTKRYLSQIPYHDQSLLPYNTLESILTKLENDIVYCAGYNSYRFLKSKLPLSSVIDVKVEFEMEYPQVLDKVPCGRQHNSRYCSLAKAFYIKDYLNKVDGVPIFI